MGKKNDQPVGSSNVTDSYQSVLMILMVVNVVLSMMMVNSLDFNSYVEGSVMSSSAISIYGFTMVLSLAAAIFFIVDIVTVHKNGYKIVGLILFAILLKPGYFIWRAHILGKQKTMAILYTIGYVLLNIIAFVYMFMSIVSLMETVM